jgi:hypothetical protein
MSAWLDRLGFNDARLSDPYIDSAVRILDCIHAAESTEVTVLLHVKDGHGLSAREVVEVALGFLISTFGHSPRKTGVGHLESGYAVELRVDRHRLDGEFRQELDQLVTHLHRIVQPSRRDDTTTCPLQAGKGVELYVLDRLAGLLPVGERRRFVTEVAGDLGDCEARWERTGRLMSVAFAMPRLAWMMRRENRRGRAE